MRIIICYYVYSDATALCYNNCPGYLRERRLMQYVRQWKMQKLWCNDEWGHLRDTEDPQRQTQHKTPWEEEILRASSLPLSVGAQILLHYLSSSAHNSYSPRYVRSVLSLTSDLMLFNMAHSLSGLEWTLAALNYFSPSLSLSISSCLCILWHFAHTTHCLFYHDSER